jgi:hypothetical protein
VFKRGIHSRYIAKVSVTGSDARRKRCQVRSAVGGLPAHENFEDERHSFENAKQS